MGLLFTLASLPVVAQNFVPDIQFACGQLKNSYPGFDIKKRQYKFGIIELDQQCDQLVSREKKTPSKSVGEFYRRIQELFNFFHDGHLSISMPKGTSPWHTGIGFTSFKDETVVTSNTNISSQVKQGDELISVGGNKPLEFQLSPIRLNLPKYEILSRASLVGIFFPPDRPNKMSVSAKFRSHKSGEVYQVELKFQSGWPPLIAKNHTVLTVNAAQDTVVWKINRFWGDSKVSILEDLKVINKLPHLKKLVLDFRNNGGGTTVIGNALLKLFFSADLEMKIHLKFVCSSDMKKTMEEANPFFKEIFKKGCAGRLSRNFSDLVAVPVGADADPDFNVFRTSTLENVPIVILTSPYSYSTTEDFVMLMKLQNRAVIIGETTGGGGIIPMPKILPASKLEVWIPSLNVFYFDGTSYKSLEGVGVAPHVNCTPLLTDILEMTDSCLEMAKRLF